MSQQLELRIRTPTLRDVTLPDLWIENRREWLAPNNYQAPCAPCIITPVFVMTGRMLEWISFLYYFPEKRTYGRWIGSGKHMLCHFCIIFSNCDKRRADCLYEIRLDHILCFFVMILCIFSAESKWLVKQRKMGWWRSWNCLWSCSGKTITTFIRAPWASAHNIMIMDLMLRHAEHF